MTIKIPRQIALPRDFVYSSSFEIKLPTLTPTIKLVPSCSLQRWLMMSVIWVDCSFNNRVGPRRDHFSDQIYIQFQDI